MKKNTSKGKIDSYDVVKKPMSGKIKKKMMKEERKRKEVKKSRELEEEEGKFHEEKFINHPLEFQHIGTDEKDLFSRFRKESTAEVDRRKQVSKLPFIRALCDVSGFPVDDIDKNYLSSQPNIPRRPRWHSSMSREALDKQEKEYFQEYLGSLYKAHGALRLNQFEHNLEVWRQLWRVTERSDIILILVDCRHPQFNFPLALYNYIITYTSVKAVCVVLTKIDLIPLDLTMRWVNWFSQNYPNIRVIPFSSHPLKLTDSNNVENIHKKRAKRKLKGIRIQEPVGKEELLSAILSCIRISAADDDRVNKLSLNRRRTASAIASLSEALERDLTVRTDDYDEADDTAYSTSSDETEDEVDDGEDAIPVGLLEESDTIDNLLLHTSGPVEGGLELRRPRDVVPVKDPPPYLTIGMLGYPNAGKSTIINALVGRKVVSVSRTPGHTKHLQTIFINPHTRLCDCPGLVFPMVDAPLPLQILFGHVNIAQVRETYSTLAYVGARIPLERIYDLKPLGSRDELQPLEHPTYAWSGYGIAEAYAIQRGYFTHGQRPDTHRAGNEILRDLACGRVLFAVCPAPSPLIGSRPEEEVNSEETGQQGKA